MPRAAKRRRSNDGDSIAVHHPPKPQKPSAVQLAKQVQVESSPLTELQSSQLPPTPTPNVDYQSILLSLADEHVTAAYAMSATLAASGSNEKEVERYHQLMSAALGCLESVLMNFRHMDPRKEGRVRLRFATLLHEETENSDKVEEVLSKGIAVCDRSKLTDLKYAMHHLLARCLAKDRPKAAAKAVETLVVEVEALKLRHWMYAFRFLRISFGLQSPGLAENAAVLKHLSAVVSVAENQRHVAVQMVAATVEAMVHLQSGAADAVEVAQRALATVRMHQLSPESQRLPQIRALLDCLDLECALMQSKPERIVEKLEQMQKNVDFTTRDKAWDIRTTEFLVSLGHHNNAEIRVDTAGVMAKDADGGVALVFDWLHQDQVYALSFLLSGVASNYTRSGKFPKPESYFPECLKMIRIDSSRVVRSLATTTRHADWQASTEIAVRLQLVALQCAHSDWTAAKDALQALDLTVLRGDSAVDRFSRSMAVYMRAVCKQAAGDLEAAGAMYGSENLVFDNQSKDITAMRDLQSVACLNRVQILQLLGHKKQADALMDSLGPYVAGHTNKSIVAAYYIIKAASHDPNTAMLKLKQDLQVAVAAGKAVTNNQLLCISMNLMTHMFFKQIVGEQAVKSARASRTLAKTIGSRLWQAVADQMFGDTLELCGAPKEAAVARIDAEECMQTLSKSLRDSFARES